jgi:hypothetical protein
MRQADVRIAADTRRGPDPVSDLGTKLEAALARNTARDP